MTISRSPNGFDTGKTKTCEKYPVKTPKTLTSSSIGIIDIRHNAVEINLKEEILSSLKATPGSKSLPTLLLYDQRGLQIFEEVRSRLLTS